MGIALSPCINDKKSSRGYDLVVAVVMESFTVLGKDSSKGYTPTF